MHPRTSVALLCFAFLHFPVFWRISPADDAHAHETEILELVLTCQVPGYTANTRLQLILVSLNELSLSFICVVIVASFKMRT